MIQYAEQLRQIADLIDEWNASDKELKIHNQSDDGIWVWDKDAITSARNRLLSIHALSGDLAVYGEQIQAESWRLAEELSARLDS
jgi:hypothetical protein